MLFSPQFFRASGVFCVILDFVGLHLSFQTDFPAIRLNHTMGTGCWGSSGHRGTRGNKGDKRADTGGWVSTGISFACRVDGGWEKCNRKKGKKKNKIPRVSKQTTNPLDRTSNRQRKGGLICFALQSSRFLFIFQFLQCSSNIRFTFDFIFVSHLYTRVMLMCKG